MNFQRIVGQGSSSCQRRKSPSRHLKYVLRHANGRSASSQRWLYRQLNDPYVADAKRLGYRSRAAFKLMEIDDKFKLLSNGQGVVDLGCAPGGWTQIVVQRIGASHNGQVVGIDILPLEPIPFAELLLADFSQLSGMDLLRSKLSGPVNVVLSDLAPSFTGHKKTDHIRIVLLAELALAFAIEVLSNDGAFVTKILLGGSDQHFLTLLRQKFRRVRYFKPQASRTHSSETYLVATGYRRFI
ncbi:ribosomal RNA large subunit methyltransferase E [Candidatus Endolissoclinum faulkneri L5]|uniref:Ribosomal RNA large subunit methyltransferase E n=1 Tax=Candidatus Endolissoclinum faulkneri L5 TaxID=1401328 RepID=V9TX69_9PROT|nr:RlmE family RNA methyltransferase [Candidatus Endolissoclinum faulkneri]AHC73930.1 ribosomal RNA large subunit methyltransferase E [Candidatus Endolissoclinum faulkneri L5]